MGWGTTGLFQWGGVCNEDTLSRWPVSCCSGAVASWLGLCGWGSIDRVLAKTLVELRWLPHAFVVSAPAVCLSSSLNAYVVSLTLNFSGVSRPNVLIFAPMNASFLAVSSGISSGFVSVTVLEISLGVF